MNSDIQILIVDDDPEMLFSMTRNLEAEGYKVLTASCGKECIDLTKKNRPDLLLLDFVLPDMDGRQICQYIRSEPSLKNLHIMMSSGKKNSSDEQAEAFDMGANAFISKPFSNRELKARVHATCNLVQTEKDLRRTKETLQSTLDGLSANIALLDENGTILLVNASWRQYAEDNGLNSDEVSEDKNYFKACSDAKGDNAEEAFPFSEGIRAVLSGKIDRYKLEYPCHSPVEERWFAGCVTPFPTGSPRRVVVSHEDITDRKKAENALVEARKNLEQRVAERTMELKISRLRFKNIFTSLSIGAIIYEPINNGDDYVILELNPAAEKIEKITMREVVGKPATQVFPGIDEFGLLDVFKQVYKDGRPIQHPVSFYKDNRIQGWRDNYIIKLPSGEIAALYSDVTEQKQAEEKILQHQNFLQKIIDGVNDGLMVINRDYTIAYANKAAMKIHKKEGFDTCATCYQISHAQPKPCSGKDHSCLLRKVIKSRAVEQVEHIHSHDNGQKRFVEISCSPILDESGEVIQVIELTRDITERKQREQFKDAQMRLSKLVYEHTSKELLRIFLDEAERITDSRIGFFHFVDEAQSIIQLQIWSTNTVTNMCKAKDSPGHYPFEKAGVWADCLRTRQPIIHNNYETLQNKKGLPDGHAPILRELVVPVFRNDQIVAVLGVGNRPYDYDDEDCEIMTSLADMAWDIISRKQAEENLKLSEERFSKMFYSSPDAIILIRLSDETVIDTNAAFERTFGYSRQLCIDKRIQELDLWIDEDIDKSVLKGLPKGNTVQGLEIQCKRSSGAYFDTAISCDTTTIEQEEHLIVIIRDISELKAAEKEKITLERQLQQSRKMESIGTLSGGIAHDFNNILAAIIGYTQLTMINLPDASESQKNLDNVLKASLRAKELVSQILTFSRNDEQELRPLKIQLIIKEALKLLRSSIPSTVTIKQNISNDCDMVQADPTQIHQIMMNLCTNSYQAMKAAGGVLDVSLKQVELGFEDVTGRPSLKPGEYLKITVSDTGAGIPRNIQDRIFDPYYTTKEKGEGTGLGLAVVHGIVNGLKGDIIVDSEPGHQTVFQILLPVISNPEKTVEKERITEVSEGNERILFVDDDAILVDLNKELLEGFGYDVTAISNSLEAYNLFQNAPDSFDLIITDMTMPHMTGDRLAEKILKTRPGMPIILITGHSDAIDPERAKEKGIEGFLNKPYIQRHLVEEIRKCLDEHKEPVDR